MESGGTREGATSGATPFDDHPRIRPGEISRRRFRLAAAPDSAALHPGLLCSRLKL